MITRVISKGGSFQGLAAYLYHDQNDQKPEEKLSTSERVDWTLTHNIGTQDREIAWRVMAGTAMNQKKLKQEAGIRSAGRQSSKSVLHYTLSWSAEESKNLTPKEMQEAAISSLKVLGRDNTRGKNVPKDGGRRQFADEHQAVIVAHNDSKVGCKHVHIMVNRVHPEHGVMLPSSNDHLKLSGWALKYEKSRGEVICEQREINQAQRKKGEYVKADRLQPRMLAEMKSNQVNDNDKRLGILADHNTKAAKISQAERDLNIRHQVRFVKLANEHKGRITSIRQQTADHIKTRSRTVADRFKPLRTQLYHKHKAEMRDFEKREKTAIGKVLNTLKSIDFGSLVARKETVEPGRASTIREAFQMLGSTGARLQSLKTKHLSEDRSLDRRKEKQIAAAKRKAYAAMQKKLQTNRFKLAERRQSIITVAQGEKAKIHAQWAKLDKDRRDNWEAIKIKQPAKKPGQSAEYQATAKQDVSRSSRQRKPSNDLIKKTNNSDLLPKKGSEQAAKKIDSYRQMLIDKAEKIESKPGHGKEDDKKR